MNQDLNNAEMTNVATQTIGPSITDQLNIAKDKIATLMTDLRQIIDEARGHVAATVNFQLTQMYWHIGERINREVLGNERAEYGKQIVSLTATQLQAAYGEKGFETRSIRRMMQFASKFPDIQIVSTLSRQLTWSHFVEVLALKDKLSQEFYLTFASDQNWSVRRLRKEIDSMLSVARSIRSYNL